MKKLLILFLILIQALIGSHAYAYASELAGTSLFSDANLVAYYKLENVNDSKNSYNLTNNNSVTFSSGLFNNASDYGTYLSQKYLYINNDLGMAGGGQNLTMSGWVKFRAYATSSEGYNNLYSLGVDNQVAYYIQYGYTATSGAVQMYAFRYQVGVTNQNCVRYPQIPLNSWHHIAYTFDGSTVSLYLDGGLLCSVASNTNTGSGGSSRFVLNQDWALSAGYGGGNNLIDDVAVFSRALSSTEISNIWSSGPAPSRKRILIVN